jgi:feruloyl esterase
MRSVLRWSISKGALVSALLPFAAIPLSAAAEISQSNRPVASCDELARTLSIPNATITRAKLDSNGSNDPLFPNAGPTPENCVVEGEIGAYVGVTNPLTSSSDYGIHFQLRMPTQWNGRFFYQGGGAGDGIAFPADGVIPTEGGTLSGVEGVFSPQTPALWRGFAVVTTDSGHRGSPTSAAFGVDPQARINFSYAAIGQVTAVSKQIIAAYFGRSAHHSYFLGCSKGGQEAMEASQRYGDQFDGIVAADPGFRIPDTATESAMAIQALAAVAHANDPSAVDGNGRPLLYKAFSHADLEIVRKGVLKACDALDGVADGMIFNVAACTGKFNPQSLQCSGTKKASCLSRDQVTALQAIFNGPRASDGTPTYVSYPYDTGLSSLTGWRVWLLGIPALNVNANLGEVIFDTFVKYMLSSPPDPTLSIFDVTTDDIMTMKNTTGGIYNISAADLLDATSTNLDVFRGHGGKIIFSHGTSDSVFSAFDTVAYYNQLTARYGSQTQDFARLYLVPGMNHCAGGDYATDYFDSLDALVNWVENGAAPSRMIAKPGNQYMSKLPQGTTRPLCPYPQFARYLSGSVKDASSYVCTEQ